MDLDKLLKVLNERQSVNEMPFETGVKQADDESDPNLTPEQLKALKAKNKAKRADKTPQLSMRVLLYPNKKNLLKLF